MQVNLVCLCTTSQHAYKRNIRKKKHRVRSGKSMTRQEKQSQSAERTAFT